MKGLSIFSSAALICLLFATIPLEATDGDLDNSFGTGGKVTTDIGSGSDEGYGLVIQSDGKILMVGSSFNGTDSDFAVTRYEVDGDLDPTFGIGGKVVTDFSGQNDYARAIAIQTDGKIVVAGYTAGLDNDDFALARYTTTGGLDSGFGTGGRVITDFGNEDNSAEALAIQQDGKIVIAGESSGPTSDDFGVARYNTNGTPDTSFSGDGLATTEFDGNKDEAHAVAIQIDGKIVAAGVANRDVSGDFALARYNTNGSPDTLFGTNGHLTTDFASGADEAYALAIQTDSMILVAGKATGAITNFDFAMVRYDANGAPDALFGTGGKVTTDFGSGKDEVYSMDLQDDGKIVLAGEATVAGDESFALARYTTGGILDGTFGTGGVVFTDFSGGQDDAYGLAIQPDDKIVAGGSATVSASSRFGISRYVIVSAPGTCAKFGDDFSDDIVDWSVVKPDWTEAGSNLTGTPTGKKAAISALPMFTGCSGVCRFHASMTTAGGTLNKVWMLAWYTDKKNTIEVMLKEENNKIVVKQKFGGAVVAKGNASIALLPNVSYDIEISYDGTKLNLFVDGNPLLTLNAATTPSGTVGFQVKSTTGTFGDVCVN